MIALNEETLRERMRRILRSITPEQIRESYEKRKQEQREQVQKAINLNIPEHADHGLAEDFEKDVQYFDALMVSLQAECACGEVLTVTREMME